MQALTFEKVSNMLIDCTCRSPQPGQTLCSSALHTQPSVTETLLPNNTCTERLRRTMKTMFQKREALLSVICELFGAVQTVLSV